MIIVNAQLQGENAYEITIGNDAVYRAFAFDYLTALDRVADYIEAQGDEGFYTPSNKLERTAKYSGYSDAEEFADAHELIKCGTNGIYLEITKVKGVIPTTKEDWYEVVRKHIIENYDLSAEDIEMATEDIVGRCFCYGIPTLAELPEYVAEYMDR